MQSCTKEHISVCIIFQQFSMISELLAVASYSKLSLYIFQLVKILISGLYGKNVAGMTFCWKIFSD